MGKRKSSAKAPPKKARPKLQTVFACPLCNADKSVSCEMSRDTNIGGVKCNQCKAEWTMKIHQLSEPIDVYSEWIDACEAEDLLQQQEQD
ncbi:hypothetical protein D9Q98_008498 [Chlorella vulgaris]|uniref:Transcription elongation factor 1 homolog n=1 Tax=Chlorella vulgaris TaxID=3077 RepID=A0A9D4YU07_CHLVU|nr:hypothetical protein D9Q98_008498 [Chlorella vulgaris]